MSEKTRHEHKNWPAVASILRKHTHCREPDALKQVKSVYLGEAPVTDPKTALTALLLALELNEDVLSAIESQFRSDRDRFTWKARLMQLQSDSNYYFGQNSFFRLQEQAIYDYFRFDDESSDFTFTEEMRSEYDLTHFLDVKSCPFFKDLTSLTVADHLQTGRTVEQWGNSRSRYFAQQKFH